MHGSTRRTVSLPRVPAPSPQRPAPNPLPQPPGPSSLPHRCRSLKNASLSVELANSVHCAAVASWSVDSLPYLLARCSRMAPDSNKGRSPSVRAGTWRRGVEGEEGVKGG